MPAHLGERHLDRPAPHEPAEHVERIGVRVGAEEALWLEFIGDIADQQPADRDPLARVMPKRRARDELDLPLGSAVPAHDCDAAPAGLRIGQALGQGRLAHTRHPGSAP